ncbi:hypothetical protein LOAG_01602 [Loa loa]|uniref:Uncharacterized protein n=1 Tax=Loa loa TaxID=7209 RepID=A0A1S0U8D2_LOALO|nr:hypothetical protein LOAG_01602 [Loa loa]EFO26879.1 hypothetical protein LOAG_01602 [Loa loa]
MTYRFLGISKIQIETRLTGDHAHSQQQIYYILSVPINVSPATYLVKPLNKYREKRSKESLGERVEHFLIFQLPPPPPPPPPVQAIFKLTAPAAVEAVATIRG